MMRRATVKQVRARKRNWMKVRLKGALAAITAAIYSDFLPDSISAGLLQASEDVKKVLGNWEKNIQKEDNNAPDNPV